MTEGCSWIVTRFTWNAYGFASIKSFSKLHWNTHHIRPWQHDTTPGKPDELFFLPELSRCEDQLIPVLQTQVDDVVSQYDFANAANENDYQAYFKYVYNLQSLSEPKDWHEALGLFHYLITLAE